MATIVFGYRITGMVCPTGHFEKLFIDFERLGKQNVDGHGLGLSIVKRIIEKLGGQVLATSENIPGRGCIFSFTLWESPCNTQKIGQNSADFSL